MCRLYGFIANAPRKVECELVRAQNALVLQSAGDEDGGDNAHGWGLAAFVDGRPVVHRQLVPAYASRVFRSEAEQVYARVVMAHVRRATVGRILPQNTHPFAHGRHVFSHNGTLGAFELLRPRLREAMTADHRAAITGTTDTEHLFHFVLTRYEQQPDRGLGAALQTGIHLVRQWSAEADPSAEVALNTLWTDGRVLVGTRLGRSLWLVERAGVHPCEVCGGVLHVGEEVREDYRAVVVASERLTRSEAWREVPDDSLFAVDESLTLRVEPL